MNALRIGLFTECYRPIQNGIVASIDALAETLRGAGHEAVVVTPHMPGYRDGEGDVVRVPSIPLPTRTEYRLTLPYVPRALGTLSIVHAHSPFVTGWMAGRAAQRAGVPLVFTYHTQLEAYAHYVPFERAATRRAARELTRAFANGADAVVAPTRTMERRLRALGVRTPIAVVPSGIDRAFFAGGHRREGVRAALGATRDGVALLLCIGRLGREKNVELVLSAFARLADRTVRLAIVGEGVHRHPLERLARRLGIAERTTFAGEFARATLPDVYASCDAFVFASTSETQGLVLVEALAAGIPVVAVDSSQTRDVLGEAATLCADEATALAAAIERALAGRRPPRAAGEAVARTYDAVAVNARLLALYESLVRTPG
ncbi:MAG: glycosyltransferase family 4 protein [Vulcanimicrobiaceae bacterium]